MANINSVVLEGRLTQDGQIKYITNGQPLVNLTIAVNRRRKRDDGRWEDEPSFIDCVYYGKPAEAINPYLEKGRQVIIQGELRQSKWETDGQQRSKLEVIVNNLSLGQSALGSNQNRSPQRSSQPGSSEQRVPARQRGEKGIDINAGGPEDFEDDNIPF